MVVTVAVDGGGGDGCGKTRFLLQGDQGGDRTGTEVLPGPVLARRREYARHGCFVVR